MIHAVYTGMFGSVAFNPLYFDPFCGEYDTTKFVGHWTPALQIYEATMAVKTPPGAGEGYNLMMYSQDVQTGNTIVLSGDTDTSVRGDVTGLWADCTDPASFKSSAARSTNIGTPVFQPGMVAYVCQCNAIDPAMNFHFAGHENNGWTLSTSWRYTTFYKAGNTTTTESTAQTIWPVTGTLKYVRIRYISSCTVLPHDVNLRIRIDGADTAMAYVLPSYATTAPHLYDDTTTEVPISAGQLASIGYQRSSATGVAVFTASIAVGFISD